MIGKSDINQSPYTQAQIGRDTPVKSKQEAAPADRSQAPAATEGVVDKELPAQFGVGPTAEPRTHEVPFSDFRISMSFAN